MRMMKMKTERRQEVQNCLFFSALQRSCLHFEDRKEMLKKKKKKKVKKMSSFLVPYRLGISVLGGDRQQATKSRCGQMVVVLWQERIGQGDLRCWFD